MSENLNKVDEFESKLKQAEEILAKLNDENTSLELSVKLLKQGQNLLNEATQILENAKLSVTQVEQ
ncbi:Exodeoxyribonuclease 7 small subunit [Campylobacter majalis]|uniref:Exodeoxyribonuclease VII small subunit n=1 Tax=Campylobacter majalis TaxID=2790656 RepID=A0ABM8Q474_9BACT|nr:exodeoxyribonuclease VII small subunit [Campylobacter majalis]CAD7287554.1 Exodeoxyribonuclease 7 small subunit [Campylobacter majalis]